MDNHSAPCDLLSGVIAPVREVGAYEALWSQFPSTSKICSFFASNRELLPSQIAEEKEIPNFEIDEILKRLPALLPFDQYSALFYQDFDYPHVLRNWKSAPEVIYYQGAVDLLSSRSVSVVGARRASDDGLKRARRVVKLLVQEQFTVMSGLAEGIDTAAHQAAIAAGGRTIAVIGTALWQTYPPANKSLQEQIAREHLLVSQVPLYQSSLQDFRQNRFFFPERNKTMAALSEATVIVEASETSGSLVQAKAALALGKMCFILSSCFEKGLKWLGDLLERGAIKISAPEELISQLRTY